MTGSPREGQARRAGRLPHSARALLGEMIRTSPREAAGAAVLLLLLTATEGASVLLLAPLLELVGAVEENPLPRAQGWVTAVLGTVGVESSLASVLLLFVAIAVARAVIQRAQALLTTSMRENLTEAFRLRVYTAMAGAEWRFLVTRTPSDFMHVIITEAGRVGVAAGHLIDLLVALLVAAVYFGLALRLSPEMALLVLLSAAVLGWLVRGPLDRARALSTTASHQRNRLHRAIVEHVGGVKVAKSYAAIARHQDIVVGLAGDSKAVTLQAAASDADFHRLLELGSTVLLAFIVYASSALLNEPAALLLVMLFIFARLMPRLVAVYRHLQALASALPVFEAVRQLERDCLAAAEPRVGSPVEVSLSSSVRFAGVSFSYLGRDTPAVAGLNLEINAGQTTAIVGASGSGKSTVADLLLGLLSPASGRILVDGQPLTRDAMASWRSQISYVPQETFLYDDTVRANLLWARPEATDAEVWDALRLAAADTFVSGLPSGLDTIVGARGVLISGGERQRLAIARALLRRPRILVLDEATSSLDTENEQRIQQSIEAIHHRTTIVVITHRLSTIRHADVIHVMDGGKVVRSGTWDALQLDRDHGLARRLAGVDA